MNGAARVRRSPVWLDAQRPLAQWYSTALGESMLRELEAALATRLGDVFGYQGLQVGDLAGGRNLLASAGLHRRLMLDAPDARSVPDSGAAAVPAATGGGSIDGTGADASTGGVTPDPAPGPDGNVPESASSARSPADIHADVTALPVAAGSMKAVLFFHTLDFCAHPHQALREADRVLTDDGQLVIVGFNPFSAFGVRHLVGGWRRREPWNGRFYARGRVADWLSVLDYRVLDSHALFVRPPINSERVLRKLGALERLEPWLGALGGLYIVRARKQTVPMTMMRRQRFARRPGIAAAGLARSGGERASNVARVDFRKR